MIAGETSETESLTAELDDLDEAEGYAWERIDLSLLTNPVVLRAILGVLVALAVLLWPERTDIVLARLVGLGLIALSLTTLLSVLRSRNRTWLNVVGPIVGVGIGAFLLLSGDRSAIVLARLLGLILLGSAIREIVALVRSDVTHDRSWPVAKIGATITASALILAFPGELFAAVTATFAIGWAALGVIAVMLSLDPENDEITSIGDTTELLQLWLHERPKAADDRRALYDKILFEGHNTTRRVVRFVVLMSFASIIASMGVITDSTAVVIGAMLIAPLMTPLMAMAISIVMGWPRRLARSAMVAFGGIGLSIGIGILLGLVAPTVIDTASNSQILARTSPTILDLIIAIAAGAAGAYGLSRPDVSDSLPGVAIAISLVPPLAVVGISYSQGDWIAGNGALLLYSTNMLAILTMGGITFVVTGVTPISRVAENQHRIRTWAASLAVVGAIVIGALLLNGSQISANAFNRSRVETTVTDWLADHPAHDSVQTFIDGDEITAVVIGPSEDRPSAVDLAGLLQSTLNKQVTVVVRLVVEERETATSADG